MSYSEKLATNSQTLRVILQKNITSYKKKKKPEKNQRIKISNFGKTNSI